PSGVNAPSPVTATLRMSAEPSDGLQNDEGWVDDGSNGGPVRAPPVAKSATIKGGDVAQAAEAVSQSAPTRPRLVFFHSKTCGRCRRVEGFIAQVLQRRRNHGTFVLHAVDVDEPPGLAERFRIGETPTLLVVADRRVRSRLSHPRGCRDIEGLL